MIKRNNKKGFTIVELVIVIAVIAILAAVLIPTFSGIIKKANLSADIQAVRQMNTLLATYVDGVDNIADVKAKLSADNIDANNYKPLSKDHDFFWVPSLNRVILVDATGAVISPEDLIEKATALKDSWKSLSGVGNAAAVDNIVKEVGSKSEVVLTGTTNFQGASLNLRPTGDLKLGGTESAPATIENVVSDEGSKVASNTGEFADNTYYAGLISQVKAGQTVTVENLTIKGATIGDTVNPESAQAGIIAGSVANGGTLIIKNVTIEDCVVFGQYKIGALVGSVANGATVKVENVTIKNTVVKGTWMVAKLFGVVGNTGKIEFVNDVTMENVTVEPSVFNNAVTDTSKVIIIDGNQYVTSGSGTTGYPYLTNEEYWYVVSNDNKLTSSNGIECWNYIGKSGNIN